MAPTAAATAPQKTYCKVVEPGMVSAGINHGTPYIYMKMGNATGTSLSKLRYRVNNGPWFDVKMTGTNKIVKYNLLCAKGAKAWDTEVQRIRIVGGKEILAESLYI